MGRKQAKKLKDEYTKAVLAGVSDLADLERRVECEVGKVEWPSFKADVWKKKAEQDALVAQKEGTQEDACVDTVDIGSGFPELPSYVPAVGVDQSGAAMSVPEEMCCSHRNDITGLPASRNWIVCVDESYLGNDNVAEHSGDFYGKDGYGLIAGVVFSSDNPLPLIEQLHCANDGKNPGAKTAEMLQREDAALDLILNHPACGVLALPSRAQEMTIGYVDLLLSWMCTLLSLLPFPEDDSIVTVRCHIEPRGGLKTKSEFETLVNSCLFRLRESFPARARRIELECIAMPKVSSGTTFNSYPDIVAHTCQCGGKVAKARFQRTKWRGVCYLDANPSEMEKLLHLLSRSGAASGDEWTTLLKCRRAGFSRSLIARIGERAQKNAAEWRQYLDMVTRHLRSGAIDMVLLRQQVEWLQKYRPEGSLPALVNLSWMTARLALANHEGHTAPGMADSLRTEFDEACRNLCEEDLGAVCRAVLNLAVAYTNSYEFEMALAVLQPLLAMGKAAVGLQNYGQLLSSAGQHFAFLGETEKALEKFSEAINCFNGLSDPSVRALNISITSAYLATATMDGRPESAIRALAYYLLGDLNASAEQVAQEAARLAEVSAEAFQDKFKHHIVLRYLVSAEREDPVRKAYRAVGNLGKWSKAGNGHPWELIEFYRALLLDPSSPDHEKHLERAYRIAISEGGDTLIVIAAVIAGAALVRSRDKGRWKDRLDKACQQVAHLRALWDNGRFQALAEQSPEGLPALDLAKKVLPFNFR